MDVFITGGDTANGGFVENNVFEKPWENTGRISNSAFAFHFRNGGNPSPDPNNWDFRYNTFVGPLSITTDENPVGSGWDARDRQRSSSPAPRAGTPTRPTPTTRSSPAGAARTTSSTARRSTWRASSASATLATSRLLAASVLRDKGNPSSYPAIDRAGNSRPVGAAPDIGAYEFR